MTQKFNFTDFDEAYMSIKGFMVDNNITEHECTIRFIHVNNNKLSIICTDNATGKQFGKGISS